MSAWILRLVEQPITIGLSVPVVALHVTAHGEEIELEVLKWASGGPNLRDLIQDEIEKGHRRLILDMCGIDNLDSCGIGEIAAAFLDASNDGAELVLANMRSQPRAVFRLTKLDSKIPVYESDAEAVSHFGS